jgi:hypothetical protein
MSVFTICKSFQDLLSPFFGPCVLSWLGSYQTLKNDNKKIQFLYPFDYISDKNKSGLKEYSKEYSQELDKLKKHNTSIIRLLQNTFRKNKKISRLYINGRLSAFQAEDKSSILFGRILSFSSSRLGRHPFTVERRVQVP